MTWFKEKIQALPVQTHMAAGNANGGNEMQEAIKENAVFSGRKIQLQKSPKSGLMKLLSRLMGTKKSHQITKAMIGNPTGLEHVTTMGGSALRPLSSQPVVSKPVSAMPLSQPQSQPQPKKIELPVTQLVAPLKPPRTFQHTEFSRNNDYADRSDNVPSRSSHAMASSDEEAYAVVDRNLNGASPRQVTAGELKARHASNHAATLPAVLSEATTDLPGRAPNSKPIVVGVFLKKTGQEQMEPVPRIVTTEAKPAPRNLRKKLSQPSLEVAQEALKKLRDQESSVTSGSVLEMAKRFSEMNKTEDADAKKNAQLEKIGKEKLNKIRAFFEKSDG